MIRTQEHLSPQAQPTPIGLADRHPAWCDPNRCTADPASQTGGYRPDAGEHRSAPVPPNLTTATLSVHDGAAWPSQACAPWPCAVYLRVQVGKVELSMSADYATSVIDALSALRTSATTARR